MTRLKKKRLYNILFILAIATVMFLCFQVLSVQVLNKHKDDENALEIGNRVVQTETNAENKHTVDHGYVDCKMYDTCKIPKQTDLAESHPTKNFESLVKEEVAKHQNKPDAKEPVWLRNILPKKQTIYWERIDDASYYNATVLEKLPRGVPWNLAVHYMPNTQLTFTCIDSKVSSMQPLSSVSLICACAQPFNRSSRKSFSIMLA